MVNEIDAIFSAGLKNQPQGKKKSEPLKLSNVTAAKAAKDTSKVKKKKTKSDEPSKESIKIPNTGAPLQDGSNKRSAPQVVVDPSAAISKYNNTSTILQQTKSKKRRKLDKSDDAEAATKAKNDDDVTFADSRGSIQRKRTDDGLLIYDAAELKIGQGGDTPQCPFDCSCCF